MVDELHPELLPTADPSKVAEPSSTINATRSFDSTVDREFSTAEITGAPSILGFDITGELARGGMGVVYAATDLTLKREVAIKTLLPGADAARFVTESEITSRLPHPGIPPVHSLGRLDDGSPYLVMKLIRGRTLADLLKERPSSSDELPRFIAIFEQIAQAVGFAHEQGIIHRDLKPLNVMVGAFGEVQVMDWGLAKDLASQERERPEFSSGADDLAHTSAGAIIGTPGYMAPEQARGEPADARADVFALGAILAAILTGKPAFVGSTARQTIEKAARGDLGETLERLGASGADVELVALAKECLAADPEKRPANGMQVATCVSDYRLGVEERLKQAETAKAEALVREAEGKKRRRAMQWAVGIVVAVLLAGIVGTSVGLKEAWRQEGIAKFEAGEKGKALRESEANLNQAKKNLAFAKKGNEILGSVFAGLEPKKIAESGRPLQDVLRENLGRAVKEIEAGAIGDPLEEAAMQNTLGMSLLGLGDFEQSIVVYEKARITRRKFNGIDHPDTLTSTFNLATALLAAGKLDLALPLYEETHNLMKAKLGRDHPDTLTSMIGLGNALQAAGKLDLAVPLLEETLNLMKAKLGRDHPHTLASMYNLGNALLSAGKHDLALPLLEETHNLMKAKLGRDHPDTLTSMNKLASALQAAGKLDLALPLLEETLKLRQAKLGRDHPDTLMSMSSLGYALRVAGKLDLALPLYEETLKLRQAKLGRDHPDTLASMTGLGNALLAARKHDLALPLLEETHNLMKTKLGRDHPHTLSSMNNLGNVLQAAGKHDLALPLFEETLKLKQANLGRDHPDTLASRNNFAWALQAAGKLEQALPHYEQASAGTVKLNFQHQHARLLLSNTASAYETARQFEKAEGWRRTWLSHLKEKTGPASAACANELAALGDNLLQQRKFAEAEGVFRECSAIRQQSQPDAWSTFNTQSMLGAALLGQKKYADAEPLLLKGYEGMTSREKSIPPAGKSRIPEAIDRLVELYSATNKPDEVKKWKAERAKYPAANNAGGIPPKSTSEKK